MQNDVLRKLAVIIPLHQEEGIAQELGMKILASLAENRKLNYILVCDNCTDNTSIFLSAILRNEERAHVVPSNRKKGYGNAINFGCEYALEKGFEWALITDSDMSNPLRENSKFLYEISDVNPEERIAIIKGNRFHRFPPALYEVPIRRMILTTLANIFCRLILNSRGGGKDPTNGFRAVNLEFRAKLPTREQGFGSIVEELALTLNANGQVLDLSTELRYDEAIRRTSQFTFSFETYKSYMYWVFRARKKSK